MNVNFFKQNSYEVSRLITRNYSTSFSLATALLDKQKRMAIYAIYGFIRLADEIVDSFHGYDKAFLLEKLTTDLDYALQNGISTNTIILAFADTVQQYQIDRSHIKAFMESMKADLSKTRYTNQDDMAAYIYGSADVVGLMCLKVFCNGNHAQYSLLKGPAQKLGSAFQKVNFLRDLKSDIHDLGRVYFPELDDAPFDKHSKSLIEQSIDADFKAAWTGVKQLPGRSKLAVALAYFYYTSLFRKIKRQSAKRLLSERIRISNLRKYAIIIMVCILYKAKRI